MIPARMTKTLRTAYSSELSGLTGLYRFGRDPLGSLERAKLRHGDAVLFGQFKQKNVLFNDPDAVEAILVGRHADFSKDLFTRDLTLLLGEGLLTNEGDSWKAKRKLMAPSFQPREIAAYGETMVACAEEALSRMREGELFDAYAAMMRLALDVVARTLFGAEFEHFEEVEACLRVSDRSYRNLWRTWRAFVRRWFPLAAFRDLADARRRLDALLLEIIAKKRARPGSDLLSKLIGLTDDAGKGMTDAEVRDEAMTVFLAGHETTALALTYTLHLLATHEAEYARLVDEVDRVLGSRRPSVADAQKLEFTNAVVRESLRLFPPVWAMARLVARDSELLGVSLKQGNQVIVSQWVIQRDARWFAEPERFRPERWLDGQASELPRFAYFPFGGGPRVCIGQHFALLEVVLILARFAQEVRFEREPNRKLELAPVVTLRPKGPVRFVLRRREPPSKRAAAE
ncbi:MAG TPA: cytochrome P450 [Polyangiaceae bacterium]